MTILRLDLSAGGWRAVPPALFEDARLSLDTRGVAGFIATRSESFELKVAGLCRMLNIGEDRWRRIGRELASAGYLKRVFGKDSRGRFRHELLFSPIPSSGFPNRRGKENPSGRPKLPDQPGPVCPGMDEPPSAKPGITREVVDRRSSYHHQEDTGAGRAQKSEIPEEWRRAAEFEVSIEEQARPVLNHGGLLAAILKRYRANGGPGVDVLAALDAKDAAAAERAALVATERRNAEDILERQRIESVRLAEAQTIADAMSRDERDTCFEAATKGMAMLRISQSAREAFIDEGRLVPGPARGRLIEALLGR